MRCATKIAAETAQLGIDIRAGLTGECERRGADVAGLAVHIGARIGALAGPREVLVPLIGVAAGRQRRTERPAQVGPGDVAAVRGSLQPRVDRFTGRNGSRETLRTTNQNLKFLSFMPSR